MNIIAIGRSFDEILRVMDALQVANKYSVALPAEWRRGAECMIPASVTTESAVKLFPKGVKIVRPWLRVTPDPSN